MAPQILTNHLPTADTDGLFRLVDEAMPSAFPASSLCEISRGDCLFEWAWGWVHPDEKTIRVTTTSHFDLARRMHLQVICIVPCPMANWFLPGPLFGLTQSAILSPLSLVTEFMVDVNRRGYPCSDVRS